MTADIQIRIFGCLSVPHDAVVAWDLLHIWPIEEQIYAEGHTIDVREPDRSYTEEVQFIPFSKYYLDMEPTFQTARMGNRAKQLNGGFRSDVANTRSTSKRMGRKGFRKISRKTRMLFHVVGAPNGAAALQKIALSPVVVIAEGYATAATIAKQGKVTALAAYGCGNLLPVATSLRQRYPDKAIVIAGDDDHRSENNPGRETAIAAAEAVAGVAIFPNLSAGQRAKGLTDFNDLATQNPEVVSRGSDEVLQGV